MGACSSAPPEALDHSLDESLRQATAYPCNIAMMPAIRNDNHTAAPATAPASPRRAKMPAPTMEPTPMKTAPLTVMAAWGPSCAAGADRFLSEAPLMLPPCVRHQPTAPRVP